MNQRCDGSDDVSRRVYLACGAWITLLTHFCRRRPSNQGLVLSDRRYLCSREIREFKYVPYQWFEFCHLETQVGIVWDNLISIITQFQWIMISIHSRAPVLDK